MHLLDWKPIPLAGRHRGGIQSLAELQAEPRARERTVARDLDARDVSPPPFDDCALRVRVKLLHFSLLSSGGLSRATQRSWFRLSTKTAARTEVGELDFAGPAWKGAFTTW
jgi:hypothetical protein